MALSELEFNSSHQVKQQTLSASAKVLQRIRTHGAYDRKNLCFQLSPPSQASADTVSKMAMFYVIYLC
jgi:hypothetical protein